MPNPTPPTDDPIPDDNDITWGDTVGGRRTEHKSPEPSNSGQETEEDRHLRETRWLSEDRGWSQNTQGMNPEGGPREDNVNPDHREMSILPDILTLGHKKRHHIEADNPIVGNISDGGDGRGGEESGRKH